ncbi:P-loop NTPase fold protein [Mucilaginibacter celer]|uniref:Uncharacterized protein n=1 Tax=Mucilaginibacter celer TaxID=2305508 RepID=A0A494VSN8_9SPHI|nr:P-loop NTPase fold protein [Mucilaginibacter celer]AYL94398.1 hypothetical protein HYN43_003380 [Mucilaginibacter celer]
MSFNQPDGALPFFQQSKPTTKGPKKRTSSAATGRKAFRLVSDTPNRSNRGLKFDHSQLVAALGELIKTETDPLSIGLFDNCGSGKSTIIEQLRADLVKDSLPVIIFDVWKHEYDAMRRTFLKGMDEHLSQAFYGWPIVRNPKAIDVRVYSAVNVGSEKIKIKWSGLLLNLGVLLVLSLLILGPFFEGLVLIDALFHHQNLDRFRETKWGQA